MLLKRASPFQTLFRFYPSSTADDERCVVQVKAVRGQKASATEKPQVREEIAHRISALMQRWVDHGKRRSERGGTRAVPTASGVTAGSPNEDPMAELMAELETSIFGNDASLAQKDMEVGISSFDDLLDNTPEEDAHDEFAPAILHGHREQSFLVAPNQVNLIKLDDAQVEMEVYPLTFRCPHCGHLEVANPQSKSVPACPCSNTCEACHKAFAAGKGTACPNCGSSKVAPTPMRQLSIIEICSRCAHVRPVFPHAMKLKLEDWVGKPIQCPACSQGHLHLDRGRGNGSLSEARWVCKGGTSSCDLQSRFNVELGGTCPVCSIWANKEANPDDRGDRAFMKPAPAMAPSNLSPLVESFLFLGNEVVNLGALKRRHADDAAGTHALWGLTNITDESFSNKAEATRLLYGIKDAFVVADVRTTTVNYGFWSRTTEHMRPFQDHERLHRFYEQDSGRRFEAYFVDTVGHGLVIALDKERLLHVINDHMAEANLGQFDSYDALAHDAISHLQQGGDALEQAQFQELLDGPEEYPALELIRLLHSLEHAMLSQTTEQVGLQVFGSKILIKDAAIILYEQEDVGDGGINQLTLKYGFLRLMRGARHRLAVCGQGCDDACPACNFIDDAECRPFVAHEFGQDGVRWVPPNALLNRRMAHLFLGEAAHEHE